MDNEIRVQRPALHTLIPLEDFKAILGLDDREDKISRFCLITATFTIEQYCLRCFSMKKYFERIEFAGNLLLPLREYPVREVLAVYSLSGMATSGELVEPDFYRVIPDLEGETGGELEDTVYSLSFSPALGRLPGLTAFKAVYRAGYRPGKAPPDLASACLELAAWNMARYRGKRIGMTGNVRGSGKDGEHLETSMPENVRLLLEPYRRKVI